MQPFFERLDAFGLFFDLSGLTAPQQPQRVDDRLRFFQGMRPRRGLRQVDIHPADSRSAPLKLHAVCADLPQLADDQSLAMLGLTSEMFLRGERLPDFNRGHL